MEDRPCEGTVGVYTRHGAATHPDRPNLPLKNDQNHCQFQNEKTQTKKTENGKINGAVKKGEETPASRYPAHGDRRLPERSLKQKPPRRAFIVDLLGSRKGRSIRNSMDFIADRSSELNSLEVRKEALVSLNGVALVSLTNCFPSKPGADNDGSGSDSGYTTPKKRKAQKNGRAGDSVIPSAQVKAMQLDHHHASAGQESARVAGLQKANEVPACTTPPPAELSRKNSDDKPSGRKCEERSGKVRATKEDKEDSWSLFRPLPVFPVDNSSAKIVPKISYASKVKENLNKAGGEGPAPGPQVPARPPQVPMSAVKTIASASFTNGLMAEGGNGCALPGSHLSTTTSAALLLVSPTGAAENVASPPAGVTSAIGSCGQSPAEPRKPSLFIYPLSPSSMQVSLPSGRQADPPASLTNRKSLGAIFQNQWGLSFINEPSAGPESTALRLSGRAVSVEVSFQGGSPAIVSTQTTSNGPRPAPFPRAAESDERTSGGKGVASMSEPEASDARPEGTRLYGAIVFCSSSKDVGDVLAPPFPTRGPARTSNHGSFDLKAAVNYHTKEMEEILNLQKQDPERVVLYSDLWDDPAQ